MDQLRISHNSTVELDANSSVTLKTLKSIPEFKAIKPKQRRFLIAYARIGQVLAAAKVAKLHWLNHYNWLKQSKEYQLAYDTARSLFGDFAEGEVFHRAFIGDERKVYKWRRGDDGNMGKVIEKYNQKSDILAIFALKGLKPQYRDNWLPSLQHGPIQINIQYPSNDVLTVNSKVER